MTDLTLPAASRNDFGKGAARKARAGGTVPAVIYALGSEAVAIAIDPVRLNEIFRKTRNANTIVQIELDGQTVPVIVQEAQRHPVSRDILHVDFYRVAPGVPVRVKVPVVPVGKAVGLGVGGRIRAVRRELEVECASYERIPATIEVDVSPLDVGQFLKASQVVAPEGVKVLFDHDFNVIACEGKAK